MAWRLHLSHFPPFPTISQRVRPLSSNLDFVEETLSSRGCPYRPTPNFEGTMLPDSCQTGRYVCLHIALAATRLLGRRPLTILELQQALGLEVGASDLDQDNLDNITRV
ncbi:hypothetical protein B0T26DRAFT_493077 [Lasiosphaeria miniovina]|uniref:Uncharacterized protein n=1 Tax=Lasiosphaeria miniovina TaxID=1954250 RepID=A0AA40DHF2_9PEZI|nr:uncharacterized protein B0T26DRAFT_493077 [Lasiosphaeria miniovina]KAK0703235.1 hypothetical protein B0T26DRAFT_493077 [Lasiosphaeria miniovina]